jgi:hypothetical protein
LELYDTTFKKRYQFQKIIVLLYLFISFSGGGYRAIHQSVELILYGGSEKMNNIRLFVALVAACILIMPALSMPNEMGQDQKKCDCPNFMKDCAQMGPGQDGKEKIADCQKPMMGEDGKQMGFGQDGKENDFGCQKSMMGEDGKQMGFGQDDKENGFGCQKSMMGEDGKKMGLGQDGKENAFGCQKSMMGEDGKKMGQNHKPIKSMMGDKGREDKTTVKIVIINVNT